jgi:tRNA-splicing ligase RtcB
MFIFGEHDDKTLEQLREVAQNAEHVALMADGHLGYVMPIGGVAAYDNQVSVVGVGFDIACGNLAIKTDLNLYDLGELGYDASGDYITATPRLNAIADEIAGTISFGIGRKNNADDAPTDHVLFDDSAWDALPDEVRETLREKARSQLGTVGSGNHYVDIFHDRDGVIWVGIHFGSRGLGHSIASGFMALAQGEPWGARVPEQETLLSLDTELGQRYWDLMVLAGWYAYQGREWVGAKVLQILGAEEVDAVHNHHNFAWREAHFGKSLVVVRKGATPAFPGQMGFVGGSMGDDAYIIRGANLGVTSRGIRFLDGEELLTEGLQKRALYSTVHGAGRVMSRSMAKGSRAKRGQEPKRRGLITRQMMSEWTKSKGVIVRGGDVDESPHVYRRLDEVIAAQGDTIEVVHTLTPLVVVMAGHDVIDPYKD